MNLTHAIEIKGLTKKYGSFTAVDSLDLSVEHGELMSLLGVNGAGKTTTIKMLCCLLEPDTGDALLDGKSIKGDALEVKRITNVSPQETAVARNLTVRENLEMIAGIYGSTKKEASEKATVKMKELGLSDFEKHRAKTLSGGYQRRLSIAMALISEPKILFLDEPTLGLDVIARRELWNVIRKLKKSMTVILTTHYMEEAESLSDRIAVMEKGRLKATGTVSELLALTGRTSLEDAFIDLASGGVNNEC